jgi:D-alanyl-D-alanine carboxypeptidase
MFSGASPPLTDQIPIPPTSTFNVNLSSADEATMLRLLGVPGRKTENCSPATGDFRTRIKTGSVGPFRVTGLDLAVDLLKAAFDEAAQQIPDVVAAAKTAGMLCVRHKRNNPNSFSNHSWGTAIDLFFGSDVVPQGVKKTERGCLLLAPFLNHHGWYWGAGFSGASVDSMHFELSKETIQQMITS